MKYISLTRLEWKSRFLFIITHVSSPSYQLRFIIVRWSNHWIRHMEVNRWIILPYRILVWLFTLLIRLSCIERLPPLYWLFFTLRHNIRNIRIYLFLVITIHKLTNTFPLIYRWTPFALIANNSFMITHNNLLWIIKFLYYIIVITAV
jgi:hypothetical protein